MKQTFSQFLTESKIQIPATTHQQAMSIVAAAYFSNLARLHRIDGEEPGPEFERALAAARAKYGDFELHQLTRDNPALRGKVVFRTDELPERYRKKMRDRDYTINLWAGPRQGQDNGGEFTHKTKGNAASININTNAGGRADQAVYNPALISKQLDYLESVVDHELQHMVQDAVLKTLHPSQFGSDEDRQAGHEDSDKYFTSDEEFLPMVTTTASQFVNSIKGVKNREEVQAAFYNAVDPRRNHDPYPFFAALFKHDQQKWKKAVKEFHRLVQTKL